MTNVSVVLPAFRARPTIARAVTSIRAAAAQARVGTEIVIASDDGTDYAPLVGEAPDLTFAEIGPVATGPGATRNRALDLARGDWVGFLDADDTWCVSYLSALLPLARSHGAAFARVSVLAEDNEVLHVPAERNLDFATMGTTGASFHPLVRRDWAGPFRETPAQDVFHAVEVLALAGGSAPVGDAVYQLRLGSDTVTRHPSFADRLERAYADYAAQIRAGASRVPAMHAQSAAAVFDAKRALNADYIRAGGTESYYAFVSRRLKRA